MSYKALLIIVSPLLLQACSSGIYLGGRSASPSVTAPQLTSEVSAAVEISLSSDQVAAVRAHFRGQQNRGRGRGSALPPGIERNLARGKSLPPGIAKQYLPQGLVAQLPQIGNGLEYVVAAGKLLLVEAATEVVRQVLLDAVYA